jgi:hypothetical protein
VADRQVRFSVPILHSTYERSFEAEIDALTSNEILVRGRMHDHRFDFEHIWRLRTPEFEVLEASAQQNAGNQSGSILNCAGAIRILEARGSGVGFPNEFSFN